MEALTHSLEKHNQIIDECSDLTVKGVSYNDSAIVLESLDSHQEAEERLLQSIELAKSAGNQFSEACRRANWAQFLVRQKKFMQAATQFEFSIGVLISTNDYWDERWKNKDIAPLTPSEIANSWFEKKWCADIAVAYSLFLVRSDFDKSQALVSLAEKIYLQIKEHSLAEGTSKFRVAMQHMGTSSGHLTAMAPQLMNSVSRTWFYSQCHGARSRPLCVLRIFA
ncbi:MAG: hypothetical protein QM730_27060 [Anaerolineales bacterium]